MGATDIRERFSMLVPLAMNGLTAMGAPDGVFCQTAWRNPDGGIRPVGRSLRYTAMSVVGLAMQQRLGNRTDLPLDRCCEQLAAWAEAPGTAPCDVGLALWALAEQRHSSAGPVAQRLAQMTETEAVLDSQDTMGLGWLLTGVAVAGREGLADNRLWRLGDAVRERLLARRHARSGLFRLGSGRFRKNILAWGMAARLASFASQVYPTVGLAYYARAAGCETALNAAREAADMLCRLQGPQGQWWWIYHAASGRPVVKYPVYVVHQDGMGPMALLAACLADGAKDEYLTAVDHSLAWLEDHPELPAEPLVDPDRGVVWRAVQRDRPDRTGGFGLARRERFRMNAAAWTGLPDLREFQTGYVCDECRPYHLGWILVADALAAALHAEQPRQT